jgi:hypothetical protein
MKGEILYYSLEETRAGKKALETVLDEYPDQQAAFGAKLTLAQISFDEGNVSRGNSLVKEIDSSDSAPRDVKAAALFIRALHLEKAYKWDEALVLLNRTRNLYPFTRAAISSPLVVTEHYLSRGNMELAKLNLNRAKDFYVSLISKRSKFAGDRFLVQEFLIENYLMTDNAAEIASILEKESTGWDEFSSAGALFRSALIYGEILKDRDNEARILKKCIELFPDTRYAKIAREQLAVIEEDPGKDEGRNEK